MFFDYPGALTSFYWMSLVLLAVLMPMLLLLLVIFVARILVTRCCASEPREPALRHAQRNNTQMILPTAAMHV